ncbi:hypothetical protein [Fodinicurvata sp. EGI_FJ10296]|uniref:hypothetical protein n=1 Tax=Fodinicurvata sp. EGI_FJ10296 TaxID=3231908 RepID=UPI00345594EC
MGFPDSRDIGFPVVTGFLADGRCIAPPGNIIAGASSIAANGLCILADQTDHTLPSLAFI